MPDREVVPGLAEKLKAAREKAGLSQIQAGEKAGVHHVSIARFETDARVPTLAILYKLAEAYGVNVCDLLPEKLEPEKETKTGKPKPPANRKKKPKGGK